MRHPVRGSAPAHLKETSLVMIPKSPTLTTSLPDPPGAVYPEPRGASRGFSSQSAGQSLQFTAAEPWMRSNGRLTQPGQATCGSMIRGSVRVVWLIVLLMPQLALAQANMQIQFVDEKTGEPIPCRVELRDAKSKPLKGRGALYVAPWTIVDGQLNYRGKAGDYTFDVHHGPEYAGGGGGFTLDKDGEGADVVRLPRHANMADENYYAADRLCFLPAASVSKWLAAEGLHTASICLPSPIDPTKAVAHEALPDARWLSTDSYYDDRPGGGLVFHHWLPPAAVPADLPSTRLLILAKQKAETRAEIVRLWAKDTPQWLASGRIDAIQILSEHLTRDGKSSIKLSDMYHPEPGQFKGARGPGRLVENLYWQVLEAGLHIPPSAGSGTSRTVSPLGYNRVYVQLPGTLRTHDKFEEGLYAGKSFVSNGPLLRATVNDELPGATLEGNTGTKLSLNVALKLTVADPVEYVDVIFNGDALYHARLDEYAKQGGKIPLLEVEQSGWLVVRVVTSREETYRLATSAPFYIQFGGQQRISKAACQFFLDWLENSRAEQLQNEPAAAKASEPYYTAAKKYWTERKAISNAE